MDLLSEVWLPTLNWQPSPSEVTKFNELYDQVLRGNKVTNLTRITTPIDFWEKHLWDSLRGIKPLWHQTNLRVIDVGTGAGFPGLPCAIVHESWQLTLLDGTLKKIRFINSVIEALGIINAIGVHGRAEEIAHENFYKNQYDLVLIRAVGSVAECLKYSLPLTRSGGTIVLYRGQWLKEEEQFLEGMKWYRENFVTPISQGQRNCIYITT